MRYIVTFFWVFLLMQMVTYVVSSMLGVSFSFETASYLSIPVTILVCIVPALIGDEPVESGQH
ncbi:YjzD family protein [Bacillus testis]|uniref:YjzD family protein n=1 Tax=Bacillus testis TaxID=1622072 RepID=UPI00067E7E7B|nr:YjzD family protein [Bacillus testis]